MKNVLKKPYDQYTRKDWFDLGRDTGEQRHEAYMQLLGFKKTALDGGVDRTDRANIFWCMGHEVGQLFDEDFWYELTPYTRSFIVNDAKVWDMMTPKPLWYYEDYYMEGIDKNAAKWVYKNNKNKVKQIRDQAVAQYNAIQF